MTDGLNLDKSTWKTYRFDEIAQSISERVEPSQTDLDIYVGLEHIDPECIHIRRHGKKDDVSGTKLRCYPGDVIFGRRRAYQRKAAICEFDGFCSAHSLVLRARPEVIDPKLFPFFMHSDAFMHRAVDISVGSLSPTINWKTLRKQEFLLPPKEQQAKITELLWAGDRAYEAHLVMRSRNEQFQASRTRDLLTASKEVNKHDCKLGSIPDNWNCLSLQELIDSGAIVSHLDGNHGSDYPRNEEFVNSGVPYISANCIEGGTVDFSKAKYLRSERAARIRKGVAQNGDILLAHNATVGPTCQLRTEEDKVILGTSLTYYRVDSNKLSSAYLLSFLKSRFFQKQLEQVMSQSTRNQVPITMQRKLLFLIPPRSQQDFIADTVEGLSKPVIASTIAMGASMRLLKSLINQIF